MFHMWKYNVLSWGRAIWPITNYIVRNIFPPYSYLSVSEYFLIDLLKSDIPRTGKEVESSAEEMVTYLILISTICSGKSIFVFVIKKKAHLLIPLDSTEGEHRQLTCLGCKCQCL